MLTGRTAVSLLRNQGRRQLREFVLTATGVEGSLENCLRRRAA